MPTDERTKEQINAAIAERLFEITYETHAHLWVDALLLDEYHATALHVFRGESYASEHNAALGLVVTEMRKRGYLFSLEDNGGGGSVMAIFWSKKLGSIPATAPFGEEPRAICEAALAALDAEKLPPIRKMGDPGYRFAYTPDAEEAK